MRVTLVRQVVALSRGRGLPDDPRLVNDGLFGQRFRQARIVEDVPLDLRAHHVAHPQRLDGAATPRGEAGARVSCKHIILGAAEVSQSIKPFLYTARALFCPNRIGTKSA